MIIPKMYEINYGYPFFSLNFGKQSRGSARYGRSADRCVKGVSLVKSGLVVKWVSVEEDGEHLAGLECAGLRRNVYFFQFGLLFFC
jgi:hypothetical protein